MPTFRLTDDEAKLLVAYLLENAKAEFPAVPGDIAQGKTLVASMGCVSCHTIPGVEKSTLAAPALAKLDKSKGCLADAPGKAPNFAFKPEEKAALTAFLSSDLDSLKRDTVTDFAARQIRALNCAACHPHDGEQSAWQKLEEEGTALLAGAPAPEHSAEGGTVPPHMVPPMTWFGEKLQTGYMAAMIAGAQAFKPRPWLASRMPGFGGYGGGIANGLAALHGHPMMDLPEVAPDKEQAAIGEKLVGADGGFNCIQCHGVKDQPPTAVFEAPGINLAYSSQRLRKGFYHRWLLAPLRVDPETKMPKFSEDSVTTPLTDVLGGKAVPQFEAIWQYLRTLQ